MLNETFSVIFKQRAKVRSLCFALKGPVGEIVYYARLKRSIKKMAQLDHQFLEEKFIFCKAVAYVLRDLRVSNSFCWPSQGRRIALH